MPRMVCCGVNHRCAAVERRELLSVPAAELANACRALSSSLGGEVALLSTCNRLEAYAFADGEPLQALREWFRSRGGPGIAASLSFWGGAEAVRHLFRVSAGLDSMVVGETEILGQVRSAYQAAREAATAGRAMNLVFQAALGTGKWVRAHTPLAAGISSVGGAAATLAGRIFSDLAERRVLILGAGKMAEASARHLLERRVSRPVVANRSPERARELASALGGVGLGLEEGLARLHEFDIVLCSAAAPKPILGTGQVREALRRRLGRPIFLVDIGVPRNVEPAVRWVDGATLYDIDSLEAIVADSIASRRGAIEQAEAAVEARGEAFMRSRSRELGLGVQACAAPAHLAVHGAAA